MDWLGDHLWAGWLVLAAVLAAAETASLDLVLAMVAVGAVAGGIAALLSAPLVLQIVVAGIASAAMLILARPPIVKRLHNGPDLVLGPAKLVGTEGVVTTAIAPHQVGQVRLGGDTWSAEPYDSTLSIAPGEHVEVLAIRGATALVHPIGRLDGP